MSKVCVNRRTTIVEEGLFENSCNKYFSYKLYMASGSSNVFVRAHDKEINISADNFRKTFFL